MSKTYATVAITPNIQSIQVAAVEYPKYARVAFVSPKHIVVKQTVSRKSVTGVRFDDPSA